MAFLPVKFYSNLMTGAPALSNTFGSLTTLLDAILITGFNTKSVTSITRTGSTVTVTTSTAHGYTPDQVINITGAGESDYNSDHRIVTTTPLTFTFEIATTPATPATGTISVKTPGLQTASNGYGWTTLFTGTNVRVYQTNNPNSKKPCLRIDNSQGAGWTASYAKFGKVTMAEGYSDINTAVGMQAPYDPTFPTRNTQTSGSGTTAISGWFKWYHGSRYYNSSYAQNSGIAGSSEGGAGGTESTGNRSWVVVGDDRGFYIFIDDMGPYDARSNGNTYGRCGYCFTDFNSFATNDACPSILVATEFYAAANTTFSNCYVDHNNFFGRNMSPTGKILMAEHHGIGATTSASFVSITPSSTQMYSGGPNTGVPTINTPDQSILLHPVYVYSTSLSSLRGKMPGYMWVANNSSTLTDGSIFSGVDGYGSKKFMTVGITEASSNTNTNNLKVVFDITGPWY